MRASIQLRDHRLHTLSGLENLNQPLSSVASEVAALILGQPPTTYAYFEFSSFAASQRFRFQVSWPWTDGHIKLVPHFCTSTCTFCLASEFG